MLLLLFVFFPFDIFSHPNDERLLKLSRSEAASMYLKLGFTHIVPLGLDHILFVISLFLLNPKLKSVLWQATAFTVAHTITLGWATYQATYCESGTNDIAISPNIIEPVIALSIMFVAVENIITDKLKSWRIFIVFAFGLIHGFGFAGALADLGMPKNKFTLSLITFNVGVELGQIAIILLMWLLIGWFKDKPWYRKRIVIPLSALIAIIALYWTIERTFFM
ncbi:MAG: HupE/UreJ family protein [Bacteroidia bacterium]|nr:HupE/UreJ family protein [Bacteroidia bacterium]